MLDIGFPEFMFIIIIAIIVLGPDKLPEALKTTGKFIGKIKRMWRDATSDIRRELELEEMKEEMKKYKEELEKLQKKVDTDVSDINKGLTSLDDLTAMGNNRNFNDMLK
ncbi:MAG: twin-arginine translocase subunit TatB [Epsilonproteobacteria bacterium]|nr:twin-arginine translocase subunit TatB [Campylobacterota bacterium]